MDRIRDRPRTNPFDRLSKPVAWLGVAARLAVSVVFLGLAGWGFVRHDPPFRIVMPIVFAVLFALNGALRLFVKAPRDGQRSPTDPFP